MHTPNVAIERLNRHCFCTSVDVPALQHWLETDLQSLGLVGPIVASHPHLFSAMPVYVAGAHAGAMQQLIEAIESVVAMPSYEELVLDDAPPIARIQVKPRGVFLGFDFHLGSHGPQLIEINTNAGGALLNLELYRAQFACCPEVRDFMPTAADAERIGSKISSMFLSEWRLARDAAPLRRIAIVDDAPKSQYLYPEFLLFQRLMQTHGVDTVIADPGELELKNGVLLCGSDRIDLIYNRLTDFYFEQAQHAHLSKAYATDACVFTPHPRAHAIYAHKRNLALLSDPKQLEALGVHATTIDVLSAGIPKTVNVGSQPSEYWWANRKSWFFKPVSGFGSRGAYRGDKLTRRVFDQMMNDDYVAQAIVAPSERWHNGSGTSQALKIDIRNYVYSGESQLVAARLYQGQTTNFRSPGGGFAPVYFVSAERLQQLDACVG